MKLNGFLITMLALALVTLAPKAQDADAAAAAARRQADEERYRRLNSAVEDLQASQTTVLKRLSEMGQELRQVREDLDRLKTSNPNYATQEDIKHLANKVQELDQKRDAERRQMLEKLQKLADAAVPTPPPRESVKPRAKPTEDTAPATEMKGYEYVVQKGDSLSAVVAEYRKQGIKVTMDMVLKANPGLKASTVYPGKKIFIPDPALK
jgi:septal ring factor EnvC (AmiA/AmiB activator)